MDYSYAKWAATLFAAASVSVSASAAGAHITINSLSASQPAGPGQTVTFTASLTSDQNVSGYPVEFSWVAPGTTAGTNGVVWATLVAGQSTTETVQWQAPASAATGAYILYVNVYNPAWAVPALATAQTAFQMGNLAPAPVAGLCGAANGVASTNIPTAGLCASGAASAVTGSATTSWSWSCAGTNGGATAICSTPTPVTTGTTGGGSTNTQTAVYLTTPSGKPGPSPSLFANPLYSCVRNVYVSTNGSDANPGTAARPFLSLQHANDVGRQAGDCVNVAPGTYAYGVNVTHGGNAATPTGYVVYRCSALDACKITNPQNGFVVSNTGGGPNYVVFDGFELAAASAVTYGIGVEAWAGPNNIGSGPHHIWVLNNIIHGYGEGGVEVGPGEYYYILHNTVYGNSTVTCDAQGSGISLAVLRAIPGYVRTNRDANFGSFNNVVAYNVAHDNMLTKCGSASNPYDTDGNGIIFDTLSNAGTTNVMYPNRSLVSFNVSYQNGGKGIHLFSSNNITVANNSTYNNNLDPYNNGVGRGEIDTVNGQNNTFINNIAYPVPAISAADPRCKGVNYSKNSTYACPLMTNDAFVGASTAKNGTNQWSNNISYGGAPPFGWGPSGNEMLNPDNMTCSMTGSGANKCNVNPWLVNPTAANFAPQSISPVINAGMMTNYLPQTAVDAGACSRGLTACP